MDLPDDAQLGRAVRGSVVARCGEHVGVVAVYRFGSTVSGSTHPASDVDLAVLARLPLDPVGLFDAAQDIAIRLGSDIDLIDLRRADGTIKAQVIGTGVRILVDDECAADRFAGEALADHAWFNELRGVSIERFLAPYRSGAPHGR